MLALRLIRLARPAVQLRRLTVTAASAGTGFLLLCSLGYALAHPEHSAAAVLRLSWCAMPLAATVYLAAAVARTDPRARPRPGLSALGLGPGRLMAVSAATTALSCGLGSLLALLFFLHLRGDRTGLPFDGAASGALAADHRLPVAGVLTLLAVVPVLASGMVALVLRPRGDGARPPRRPADGGTDDGTARTPDDGTAHGPDDGTARTPADRAARAPADRSDTRPGPGQELAHDDSGFPHPPAPRKPPAGLPWGVAVLAAGLAVESYAGRYTAPAPAPGAVLPGGLAADSVPVLLGWLLTALGLALAGPGLTHLCGLLLQSARPGALRLLAGRTLMAEAGRIGRPLGVVCAVASGTYAVVAPYDGTARALGPLTALGTLLVAGCAVAVLLTAAVEARQSRAATIAALRRLGAPATVLRTAALLRAGALLALFAPLTLLIAGLAALPLAR